jgi:thioredoxin-related protein
MKTFIFILLLFNTLYANHIKWYASYDKAFAYAKEHNKKMIVYLIQNNCKRCKDIVATVFTNKPYIDKLNVDFVSVIVNFDDKVSYPLEMYYSNVFPTLFIVEPKEERFIKVLEDTQIKTIKDFID